MSILPYAFVLLAAVLWGTVGTTQTFLTDGINPLTVAMMRSAVGGGTLLIIATLMRKIKFRHWAWKYTFLQHYRWLYFNRYFFHRYV